MKFRLVYSSILVLVLALLAVSCGGSGILVVGEILGPDSVNENTTTQYGITASGDTGITYLWACDPASAGSVINETSAIASFIANSVDSDTPVTIIVTVTSDSGGPEIREKDIMVLDTGNYHVGEIVGPTEIGELSSTGYSIDVSGDTGITYSWTCIPNTVGDYTNGDTSTPTFNAGSVSEDTDVLLRVTVDSDNNDPVMRELAISVLNGADFPDPFPDPLGTINDIAIEADGDIAIANDTGVHLYDQYGQFKITISDEIWQGLNTTGFGEIVSGRGVIGVSNDVNHGASTAIYDNSYNPTGMEYWVYNELWWDGDPDPYYPGTCVPIASTSTFTSCDQVPHPIAYHPDDIWSWQKVFAPDSIADPDCAWPIDNMIDSGMVGGALLAYNRNAPLVPDFMALIFEGGQDYLLYYDYPTFMSMQNLAAYHGVIPACALPSYYIIWDLTDFMFMSDRPGVFTDNIGDFEFDELGRLIMTLPVADTVCITEPVVFGDPIVIGITLGGTQGGFGGLPGEFFLPKGVAIDPGKQNFFISDYGYGRVQVFDPDGNFIRQFGKFDTDFMPGAIRMDNLGTLYVANVNPDRPPGDDLRIFDEFGDPVVFGGLDGYMYDNLTSDPIVGEYVDLGYPDLTISARTDEFGYYHFVAVPIGSYTLSAEVDGYLDYSTDVEISAGVVMQEDIYLE